MTQQAPHHGTPKNILIIFADQWRDDQFGAPKSYTPNLDNLAGQGVRFENHFTQNIPCAPSRASIYTGLYSQTHGVINNKMPLDSRHKTLGHYLRDNGYNPTLFGYTDTTLDPRDFHPNDPKATSDYEILPGFEAGCHMTDKDYHEWLTHLRTKGLTFDHPSDVYKPDFSKPNGTGGAAGHPAKYSAEDSDTAFLTNRLMGWQREQQQGWCAMLCYLRPHNPTIAPEPYNSLVDPDSLSPPIEAPTVTDEGDIHPFMRHQMGDGNAGQKACPELDGKVCDISDTDKKSIRAIHLALMAEIDDNLGRLFQQIKDMGQWEDTLIVFSSDHSEMMLDHRLCNQASWHDQCAHVPMIIKAPESTKPSEKQTDTGRKVTQFSEGVDLIPTLLDMLGQDIPPHLDGRSLMPFVRGEIPDSWRDFVCWEYHFWDMADAEFTKTYNLEKSDCMMMVYRDDTYKHVYMPKMPPVLLNMQDDPHEFKNLADDPKYAPLERDYLAKQMYRHVHHIDRVLHPDSVRHFRNNAP